MGLLSSVNNPRVALGVVYLTVSILVVVISSTSVVTSLPNIRIQVNKDNLQNPPYLIDAAKQFEKQEAAAETAGEKKKAGDAPVAVDSSAANDEVSLVAATDGDAHEKALPMAESLEQGGANLAATFGVPKGSPPPVEETLNLGHESFGGHKESAEREDRDDFKQANNGNRNFQLDVTSSHLKRPSVASSSEALVSEELAGESSSQQATLVRHNVVSRPPQAASAVAAAAGAGV